MKQNTWKKLLGIFIIVQGAVAAVLGGVITSIFFKSVNAATGIVAEGIDFLIRMVSAYAFLIILLGIFSIGLGVMSCRSAKSNFAGVAMAFLFFCLLMNVVLAAILGYANAVEGNSVFQTEMVAAWITFAVGALIYAFCCVCAFMASRKETISDTKKEVKKA